MKRYRIKVPIIQPMDYRRANVYEHTPLNPWAGEYPRFIRPVGAHMGMREGVEWEWKWLPYEEAVKYKPHLKPST